MEATLRQQEALEHIAAATVRGACVTESSGPSSVLGYDTWVWSDHFLLWAELQVRVGANLELNFDDVPRVRVVPRAYWETADETVRGKLQDLVGKRTAGFVAEPRGGNGLRRWGWSWERAAAEVAAIWLECETDAVGRRALSGGGDGRLRGGDDAYLDADSAVVSSWCKLVSG